MKPVRIAIDAMGGDHAPFEILKGVASVLKDSPIHIMLYGDKNQIDPLVEKFKIPEDQITVFHCEDNIGMDESPKSAIENKPDASILRAAQAVAVGKADALVSAGSTGSVVLAAAKNIPRIMGVRRTAIATVYPTMNELNRGDRLALILDVGANVHSAAEELVQFAIMGAAYVSDIRGIKKPVVALLNIGEESTKGGENMQEAYKMLKTANGIEFVGNIEGKDILRGNVDVVVTEGFVGNIVIKTLEGAAQTLSHLGKIAFKSRIIWRLGLIMLKKGLSMLKEVTDYSEYGGAPLLGFEKIVIIAHGRSDSKAIANALKLASKCVKDDVCGQITKNIREFEIQPSVEYSRITSGR